MIKFDVKLVSEGRAMAMSAPASNAGKPWHGNQGCFAPDSSNQILRTMKNTFSHSPTPTLGRLFLAVMASALLALNGAHAGEVRVGVSATDITPPMGMPMAGYYHARGADGVLDPLFSKAMVLELDGERVALVTLDMLSVTRAITDQARAIIEKRTGIKGAHVMISATHAHTGPELANRSKRSNAMGGLQEITVEYTESLPNRLAESVRLANERLQGARLSLARGRCDALTFNRRYLMRDGSVGWNPGKLNPNIVKPAGATDPEVGVLLVELTNAAGPAKSVATYVNFAMHPDTTGGSKLSADWPGALSRVLAGYHGTNHFTMVANGTCGNLNHVDVSWKWPQSGPGEQNRIAAILGASVFEAYKQLKPVAGLGLRAKSEIVELALPETTPQALAEANQAVAATKDDRGTNFMKLVRAYRTLDVAERKGKPHQLEVQVIALGRDVAWVGLSGEVFVELGLALKKRSPFAQTFIVELANENIGYIPDRRSYAEGNYEPESSRCAAGSGERLVEAAFQLLADLHRSAATP
ncbi:MAG: neutral/alkaline non-lysosomal ceramidase N-terminal domain-containing protein [Verrucomicrobia bacterium]|nr:neutral/alkaline non-lysosomal ceramidase N-terminal domain-containing protein [Verrucomicrobiota bacterium]